MKRNAKSANKLRGGELHNDAPPPASPGSLSTYQVDENLRDGTPVCVRAVRPGDKAMFETAFDRQSAETIHSRFFHFKRELSDCDLKNFTEVDFDNHVGLIMTIVENNEERLIGVGRFVREASEDEAESAFVVDDEYQGRGAASSLLQHLVKLARRLGITIFKAYVQADNLNMLGVFERSGLPMTKTAEGDITQIVLRFAPE
ncbi:MAG: GNAT family N-acetyltransferase [Burkholderiales bacterium]|nr:GNAT family N-acetyltransferase [Burkholderiales bacterium]